jgi:amino acid transporter
MSATRANRSRLGTVTRALAKDRLGLPAVLFFVLAGVAPLTVAAGVIPTAYQTTGLTGIPAAFLVVAVILAIFAAGYVAIARHIQNAGACYAFIAQGIGRVAGSRPRWWRCWRTPAFRSGCMARSARPRRPRRRRTWVCTHRGGRGRWPPGS